MLSLRTSPQGINFLVWGPIGPMIDGPTEAWNEKARRKSVTREERRGIELKKTSSPPYLRLWWGDNGTREKRTAETNGKETYQYATNFSHFSIM